MCNNDMPMILLAGIGFEAETVEDADRDAKESARNVGLYTSWFKTATRI